MMKLNYVKIYEKLLYIYNLIPYRFFGGFSLPPSQYYLGLTYDCNIDCAFCYEGRKDKLQEVELSLEEVKRIVDQIPFYGVLTYVGGEPLIRRDIKEIVEYSSKKCKFTIITNGSALTEKTARWLVDKGLPSVLHKGLVEIGVSLSGTEQMHDKIVRMRGAYAKTIEGVRRIVKARKETGKQFPLISLRIPILKENVSTLHNLVELGGELGVEMCFFILQNMQERIYNPFPMKDYESEFFKETATPPHIPEEVLRREFDLLRTGVKNHNLFFKYTPNGITEDAIVRHYSGQPALQNFVCYQPWQKLVIAANGDPTPCVITKEGNLKTDTIMEIWNRKIVRDFRRNLKVNKTYPTCLGCCGLTYLPNGDDLASSSSTLDAK